MSEAAAVALSFVVQEKLHTARCRSELAQFLAVDPHEPPDAELPANPRTPERRVADGTNMVLLEEHGHPKVVVAGETMFERRAPEIDEHIRLPFRLRAAYLEPRRDVRLAFRVNGEGERVGLLLIDLLGLRNIYPELVLPGYVSQTSPYTSLTCRL